MPTDCPIAIVLFAVPVIVTPVPSVNAEIAPVAFRSIAPSPASS